jgi:hypothetical protein
VEKRKSQESLLPSLLTFSVSVTSSPRKLKQREKKLKKLVSKFQLHYNNHSLTFILPKFLKEALLSHSMDLALSYLLSFLLLLLLLPYSTIAQTSKNQSLGSSLTAQNENSYWASPSGDFAFGFQQVGNGGYLLAIWFNILPEKNHCLVCQWK